MMRTQFPIVAGFALTVNKAQGLTVKEGVVIHLVGGARFRPRPSVRRLDALGKLRDDSL